MSAMPPVNEANGATVKLHRTLYPHEAIAAAAATFADFATFAVRSDGDYYVVEIGAIRTDVEGDVIAEFCNFALANAATYSKSTAE